MAMNDRSPTRLVALAFAVVLVGNAVGMVAIGAAQETATPTATPTPAPDGTSTPTPTGTDTADKATLATDPDAREAALTIEQPHYKDATVTKTRENGTTVYEATGQAIRLYPESFSMEDVVSVTVSPGSSASLSQTPSETGYALRADNEGTYLITWEVDQDVPTENDTTIQRHRYQAIIRVSDIGSVTTVEQQALTDLKRDAEKWREINATASQQAQESWILALLPGDPDSEEWIQSALDKQRLVHNPGAAFGNGITLFVLALFSLGGALVASLWMGWHARVVQRLSRRLNIHESVEQDEGDVVSRLERQHMDDKLQSLQNEKHSNLFLPHEADAMREIGETPLEADINLWADTALPSAAVALKARAMGESGYVGVVPEDILLPDGGTDGDDDDNDRDSEVTPDEDLIETVRAADAQLAIVDADEVAADVQTVDLTAADRDWLDVLPVDSDAMLSFDPADVDVDRPALSVDEIDWTVQDLVLESGLEMRHFNSAAEAGRHLRDFLEWVRSHEATDPDGTPREERYVLETWLRNAQLLDDRFGIPKQHAIDVLEAAIMDDDPVADGRQMVADKELGKYA